MSPYWITFTDKPAGCIEAKSKAEALELAKTLGQPEFAQELPYPGNPRLNKATDCPSFCYSPAACAGKSCCPKRPSCVD